MRKARFEGLTRIVVDMNEPPGTVGVADVKVDGISASEIKTVKTDGNRVAVFFSKRSFIGEGEQRGKLTKDAKTIM